MTLCFGPHGRLEAAVAVGAVGHVGKSLQCCGLCHD